MRGSAAAPPQVPAAGHGDRGFWGSQFDFSFQDLVTPRIIRQPPDRRCCGSCWLACLPVRLRELQRDSRRHYHTGTVAGYAAVKVAVEPSAAAEVQAGESVRFTARVTTLDGSRAVTVPSLRWEVSGGGKVSGDGVFTAGQTGGTFRVTAVTAGVDLDGNPRRIEGSAQVKVTSQATAVPTVPPPPVPPSDPKMATVRGRLTAGYREGYFDIKDTGLPVPGVVLTFSRAYPTGKYQVITDEEGRYSISLPVVSYGEMYYLDADHGDYWSELPWYPIAVHPERVTERNVIMVRR